MQPHRRPWMSEQSFISVNFFHIATDKSSRPSFNRITMATAKILYHKAQELFTANDHHTVATFITIHTHINICYIRYRILNSRK
jgi:hypothetical protein